ncbi:MAG: efflux RND transporter periplasmic adaptor subunit [Xanthomonadales bacterium]|nr:efflux RND transporter periplasmic adaptor subunit [Xanthomonadales bacterium]
MGRIEPRGGIIRVGAPSTPEAVSGAILKELKVEEGDRVEAGQLLAVTDAADVTHAQMMTAQAELELAEIAAEAASSRADEACVLAQVAASEASRRADLLARELASREEAEQADGEAQARRASCTAAQATARVAAARIEVARSTLRVHQAELERTRIVAPVDGMVLHLIVLPGELIGAEGILELGKVREMVATAEVYETDIHRVSLGQRAEIRSDALPATLEGTVEAIALKVNKQDEIGTDPAARKDARIIEVEILLDEPRAVERLTNLQVEVIIHP